MAHIVRVNAGFNGVSLPDGEVYDGEVDVVLTDEQFEELDPDAFDAVLTDLGAISDAGESTVLITTQAGVSYTLDADDAGSEVEFTNVAAVTVTIPPNATVAFAVGTWINLRQMGTGQVTVAPADGVTLRAPGGAKTRVQYATVALLKRATDEWVVAGDAVV